MQVQGLAVVVAAGRTADFDEFFDFGMIDGQVDCGRAPAQAALADRERHGVHHADERHDAGGLADAADRLPNRAQIAPIAADAAAAGREPDILRPEIDNALQAVVGLIQIAGYRQAPVRTAVRKHRRGRHEPEPGNIIIDALRMC